MGHQWIRTMQVFFSVLTSKWLLLECRYYVQPLICRQGFPKLVLCQCFLGSDLTFSQGAGCQTLLPVLPSPAVRVRGTVGIPANVRWKLCYHCIIAVISSGFLLQFFLHFKDSSLFPFSIAVCFVVGLCCKLCRPW